MKLFRALSFLALAALASATTPPSPAAPPVVIHDLGTLGSGVVGHSIPVAISSGGLIAARHSFSSGRTLAYAWSSVQGWQNIGTLGGAWSDPKLVTTDGQVFGTSMNAANEYRLFRWTAGSGIEDLGSLGIWAFLIAASPNGQYVVGFATPPGGGSFPFVWSAATGILSLSAANESCTPIGVTDLGLVAINVSSAGVHQVFLSTPTGTRTLLATGARADRMNAAGLVAGIRDQNPSPHGLLWGTDGSETDLGVLAGITGINDAGQVVGNAFGRAYRWTPGIGLQELGTLGGSYSHAAAINNSGQVIGDAALPNDAGYHIVLWDGPGAVHDAGALEHGVALNDAGQMTGTWRHPSGTTRGFLWSVADGFQDLGSPESSFATAVAVNQQNQIAGNSILGDGWTRAFFWSAQQGMLDLGTLGGPSSNAVAINGSGQIVGYSTTASGSTHAFLWTPGQGMIDLDPTGSYSTAVAINDSGRVAGSYISGAGSLHAFSWITGGMQDLGELGYSGSSATAMNALGQIVGTSQLGDGRTHAFLWTPGGFMQDLGELDFGYWTGFGYSSPAAINNSGQVVGTSWDWMGNPRAVLWSDGNIQDLGDLGGFSGSNATAINDAGQVAGTSGHPDGNMHAFRWSPGGMEDLGGLSPTVVGIGNDGSVVGNSYVGGFYLRAVIWKPGEPMTDLGSLPGGDYTSAAAIHNGQVVGYSEALLEAHAVRWDLGISPVVTIDPVAPVEAGTASHLSATATDPLGGELTYSWSYGGVEIGSSSTLDYVFPLGDSEVTLTVSSSSGATTKSVTVSVVDHIPPQLFNFAPSSVIPQTSVAGASFTVVFPMATDNSGLPVQVTARSIPEVFPPGLQSSGPFVFPKGDTAVIFDAVDVAGNQLHVTTSVSVVDIDAPVFTDASGVTRAPGTIAFFSTGPFSPWPTPPPSGVTTVLADVNGDGMEDLIESDSTSDSLNISLADGGSFGPPLVIPVGADPSFIAIGDLDRDGRPDIVVSHLGSSTITVLQGHGDGTFGPLLNVGAPPGTIDAIEIALLNPDGKPDLRLFSNGNVAMLINLGSSAVPVYTLPPLTIEIPSGGSIMLPVPVIADLDEVINVTRPSVSAGVWTIWWVARDSSNNESRATQVVTALEPPETTILSGPPPFTSSTDGTFTFSSPEAGATFEYSLDQSAFSPIASPAMISGLSAGTHTYAVRAVRSGMVDPTPAEYTWFIDLSSPVGGMVNDGLSGDLAFQASLNSISASWSGFADPESGIVRYEWAIGSTPGGLDIQGFADVGTATQATATGLLLKNGKTYYVTVRAFNDAGESIEVQSNGIRVDSTPPTGGKVNDGPDVDIDFQVSTSALSANWSGFVDTVTGIDHYEWAIGTSKGGTDVQAFVPVGQAVSAAASNLNLQPGQKYFVTVRAVNGVGLATERFSDGVTVDTSAPLTGTVKDGPAADLDAQASATTIQANWSGFTDPESGIAGYEWAIRRISDGFLLQDYVSTGLIRKGTNATLALSHGDVVQVLVRATNKAGLSSVAASDGVIIDETPPAAGVVLDGITVGVDLDSQTSTTTIKANWSPFQDSESGVAKLEWSIGTTPGGAEVFGFTNLAVGALTASKAGLGLTPGTTYYVTVRATNGAGLQTQATSDGVQVQ